MCCCRNDQRRLVMVTDTEKLTRKVTRKTVGLLKAQRSKPTKSRSGGKSYTSEIRKDNETIKNLTYCDALGEQHTLQHNIKKRNHITIIHDIVNKKILLERKHQDIESDWQSHHTRQDKNRK